MKQRWLIVGAVVIATAYRIGLFDTSRLIRGIGNLGTFAGDLLPPNLSVAEVVLMSLLETIQIALVGTVLGFFLALPLAILAARNISGALLGTATRLVLAIVRTIPSLLWAIIMVVAFGLGPVSGALGLSLYTLGYLGKLFYEAFEAVDPEVLEGIRGVGSSKLQTIRFGMLPEASNQMWSQLLFMFEYNIRASSIIGFVGAGGVGFYMLGYIQLLQYQNLMTVILLTLIVVLAIDYLSSHIRRRYLFIESKSVARSQERAS